MTLSASLTQPKGISFSVSCLAIALALTVGPVRAESGPAVPASDAGKPFGTVWKVAGEVVAEAPAGASRQLHEGDSVLVGDRLRASGTGEAVIRTGDAGLVAIRPGAEVITEHYQAIGRRNDNWAMRLVTGSLRVVTGWIGKINRRGYKITTPNATIGVRGTDHEPYVLTAEGAAAGAYREGTYDKVNRGGTTLQAAGRDLDVDPGQVGFARAAPAGGTRGLMTVLFPVLLDSVPGFYVPGRFDGEMDRYAKTAEAESARLLAARQKAGDDANACVPKKVARDWLKRFDGAIARHDAAAVVALFAEDVTIKATVRTTGKDTTTLNLGRQELADSAIEAMAGLKHYQQRRLTLEATAEGSDDGTCGRVSLRSEVVEKGTQKGKAYRFESLEEFVLEARDGQWLAVKASTTQH